ncbi:DUF6894 family protein [Bradyrhizobium sp. DASA03076]|uniref:DUF6894 family protein n=1 Tax=Bradyrhizobium sp. BLXBL-03 TaxID=3395916 RepID=UPI003F72D016
MRGRMQPEHCSEIGRSGEMPRYYFNIHNGHPFEDLVGEDLPDEAAAWKKALLLSRDIEDVLAPGGVWKLEVLKPDRSPLFRIEVKTERLK